MSYWTILLWIIITILVIIIAILVTIGIDNLARISTPTDPFNENVLDTVISLGSFIIILLIFLIALGIICAILAYYYTRIISTSSWLLYAEITFIIFTIGLLILEYYTYRELTLYKFTLTIDEDDINSSTDYLFWAIILTVIVFFLSLLALL